jgi:hypothetical protein
MNAIDDRRPRSRLHIVLVLAVVVATWLPMAYLSRLVSEQGGTTLASARFVAGPSTVRDEDARWQPVELPDDWRVRRPGASEGWYRFRVEPSVDEDRVVYFPVVMMNAAVYFDGELVGTGGRMDDPVARNWNRPLLMPLPASSKPGILDVRVKTDLVDSGYLPQISVGARSDLGPIYDRAHFLRRSMLLALVVLRLVVAAATIAVWAMWRKEAYYGWFGLCAIAWVLAEINLLVVDIPTTTAVWYWIQYTAIGWWGLFGVALVLDFVGTPKPRLVRSLFAGCALGSLALGALALADSPWLQPFAANVWLASVFVGASTLLRGVFERLARRPDTIEYHVVLVVTLSVLGGVLYDLLMQLGVARRGGLNIPSLTSLVAITGMGWVLLRRFLRALEQTREMATSLERLVDEKHAELERSYEQLRLSERASILATERERVLRDMHEGMGSHLVSTLAILDDRNAGAAQLARKVRAALDDLRLVIDSLDPESELLPALAALRTRLEPRLSAAGVRVEWKVEDLPPIADFGPEKLLQVLRLVQEALSAVLERPGATRIVVRTCVETTGTRREAVVEIDDDLPRDERDLPQTMAARARAIGAQLIVNVTARGSALRLAIPCEARPECEG